jgi:hypothetical protein
MSQLLDFTLFYISIIILLLFVIYFDKQPIIINQKETNIIEQDQEVPLTAGDLIRNWDYRKIIDPLVAPTRRMPIQNYPPNLNHPIYKYTDIATRGYPDNYNYYGTLVRTGDEKIIKLFGRERQPNSTQFDYFGILDEGGSQVKIPIHTKTHKELQDKDEIDVHMLDPGKGKFIVHLGKQDELRYVPFVY